MSENSPISQVETLFGRHRDELQRFLQRHLKDWGDVEDCAQETFMKIWRSETGGSLREDGARGYIFTTAMNVMRDMWRRKRTRATGQHEPISDTIDDEVLVIENETTLAHREGLRLVEAELLHLKDSTRAVFLLFHVRQLSTSEIAEQLGLSTRTVEREMARALAHLQHALGDKIKDIIG